MRKLLNEALDTRVANNLCEYWLQMNGTGFLVQIEKFLGDFVFSSISFLNISAFYM